MYKVYFKETITNKLNETVSVLKGIQEHAYSVKSESIGIILNNEFIEVGKIEEKKLTLNENVIDKYKIKEEKNLILQLYK